MQDPPRGLKLLLPLGEQGQSWSRLANEQEPGCEPRRPPTTQWPRDEIGTSFSGRNVVQLQTTLACGWERVGVGKRVCAEKDSHIVMKEALQKRDWDVQLPAVFAAGALPWAGRRPGMRQGLYVRQARWVRSFVRSFVRSPGRETGWRR